MRKRGEGGREGELATLWLNAGTCNVVNREWVSDWFVNGPKNACRFFLLPLAAKIPWDRRFSSVGVSLIWKQTSWKEDKEVLVPRIL